MKLKYFLFFQIIGMLSLMGQTNPIGVYQQLMKEFSLKDPVSYTVRYLIYKNHQSREPEQSIQMDISKVAGISYLKLADMEVLYLKDRIVQISHTDKLIYVQSAKNSPIPGLDWSTLSEWKDLLSLKGSQKVANNGRQLIQLTANDSKMKLELEYDPNSRRIYRTLSLIDLSNVPIISHELDQKKVAIYFSNYTTQGLKIPLQIKDIYKKNGQSLKGLGPFKGYEIIDLDKTIRLN